MTDKAAIRSLLMEREKGSPEKIAEYFRDLDPYKGKDLYIKMPPADQVRLEKELRKSSKGTDKEKKEDLEEIEKLKGHLSEEDKGKRRDALKKANVKLAEDDIKKALKGEGEKGREGERGKKEEEKGEEDR